MRRVLLLILAIASGIMFTYGLSGVGLALRDSAKVEAQSPQRFQLQASENVGDWELQVICDAVTGTLIYRTPGYKHNQSYGATIAAVPNGCAKNPR
ncbi:MAG: hypothetical protein Q8R55_02895 [Candidatus Taylorbacteria bacterium]|nr:hypothetical protein [Candidatus Taylorbacteria bacterium]